MVAVPITERRIERGGSGRTRALTRGSWARSTGATTRLSATPSSLQPMHVHEHLIELQSTSGDEVATLQDCLVINGTESDVAAIRPPTDSASGALPISVSLTVTNVFKISESASTVNIEGQLVMQWHDSRLMMPSGLSRVQLDPKQVWNPQVDFYNAIEAVDMPATKMSLLGRPGHALCTMTQRFVGSFAMRMNFVYYPGDKHALPIEIEIFGNPDSSVYFNHSEVNLMEGVMGSSIWSLDAVDWRVDSVEKPSTGLSYSRLIASLNCSRVLSAYVVNLYMPLILMLVLTWATFFVDPRVAPARGGLAITSLLVSYTFYNHVQADMPTTAYLTFTDIFCCMTIFGGVIGLFAFIRVHWLLRQAGDTNKPVDGGHKNIDYKGRAESADATCRLIFPAYIIVSSFLALIPIIRSTSDTFDVGEIK